MTIHEISGNLGAWFSENWIGPQYTRVYVSIGGKLNEREQRFNYPDQAKNKLYYSNAAYQMIPAFLRNTNSKALVILVDRFYPTDDLYKPALATVLRSNPHIDVLLLDLDIGASKNIKYLIQDIMGCVIKRDIKANRLMICNFIRFSHPNSTEIELEERVPNKIQRYLNRHPAYVNCFYQWYGYSIYTYNLVYQYRHYDVARSMHCSILLRLFERTFKTFSINSSCIQLAQMGVDNMPTQKALVGFLRYSIDFTENYAQTESLGENLGHYTYH
jgi:hypothetical protein